MKLRMTPLMTGYTIRNPTMSAAGNTKAAKNSGSFLTR